MRQEMHFLSVITTFPPAGCCRAQMRAAIRRSSLVEDAAFGSALTSEIYNRRPADIFIFSRLMSQAGHVILPVVRDFTCSFHLSGIRATHSDRGLLLVQHMVTSK